MFVRPAVREGSAALQPSTDGGHQSRDIVNKYAKTQVKLVAALD